MAKIELSYLPALCKRSLW